MNAAEPQFGRLAPSQVDDCIALWSSENLIYEHDFRKRLIRAINRPSDLSSTATIDGRVVGCVLALFTEFNVYAHRIVVHADFRRRGIGSRLMRLLEQEGRHLGAGQVILNAGGSAAEWFEALGYARTGASFFFKNLPIT